MSESAAVPLPRYTAASRWLHWITALLVLATIPAGIVMVTDGLPRGLQNGLFIFHKNVGVVILALVVARLGVRAVSPAPALPHGVPAWQRHASRVSHAALYALLIVMAVSGYVRVVAGGFPLEMLDAIGAPRLAPRSDPLAENAKAVHAGTRYALGAVILLHVAAAAYHALIRRDGVFGRMWPPVARR
jgi:cytochrome b561